MQFNCRIAREQDLQPVFDLYMDPSSNPYLTFDTMSREAFSKLYSDILQAQNLFVAESGGEVIATFRLIQKEHRQAHILYLGSFTVKSTMKGRGVGFEILKYIKAFAESRCIKRIELTVDTENHAAINLYRKVGFEIEGKLKNNYRLASSGLLYDEYVMALLLN